MNPEDEARWLLIGEYRAPYVASAIVIAVMTKQSGNKFLQPITADEAANLFGEIYGEHMSSLMISPALQLLVQWGLADVIEDEFVQRRYKLNYDAIDVFYDSNWDHRGGLIYKLRATEPLFLQEALRRTEHAAATAFADGERPGNLLSISESEVASEARTPIQDGPALNKSVIEENSPAIRWGLQEWAAFATIVTVPLGILLWWFS